MASNSTFPREKSVDTNQWVEIDEEGPSNTMNVNVFMVPAQDTPKRSTKNRWLQKQIKRRGIRG